MKLMALINEIGPDADLLTRSDQWLEKERHSTAAEMSKLAEQLRAIQVAQRIKRALQQKNLVALRQLIKDETGEIVDILVRVISLPDALVILREAETLLDKLNAESQYGSMRSDGYDLETSAALR